MNPARSNYRRFIPALAAAGGRLWKLFGNGQLKAQYTYNASGQRTRKTLADGTETVYHYDSQGRLIAETSQTGQPLRDYIWADDRPVAQIETHRDAADKLHNDSIIYLFSDHLNTPRIGMDQASQIIWRNDSVGFGEQAANDDPDGDSNATVVNLRFPGQYFDQESKLHYNWNRYYDPETGRYITSDPIGLDEGGNTYLYANANPIIYIDLFGLYGSEWDIFPPVAWPQISDEADELKHDFIEATGYASERKECESYINCTVRCVGTVLGMEMVTTGAKRKLESIAKLAAKAKAAAWIAGAGTFSTSVSGIQMVSCSWKCVKK